MNNDSKEDLWLVDHLIKCRCCFKNFDRNEKQVIITEIIEEQFLELTKIEVIKIKTNLLYIFNFSLLAPTIYKLFKQSLYEMHK